MITIRSGKIIIPEEDRFVGFAGDNRSRVKEFLLRDAPSGELTYTLYLKFDDGRVTSVMLAPEQLGADTLLTWNISREHLIKSGVIMAQLKIADSDGVVSHTGADYFIAQPGAEIDDDGDEFDILSRSEFERRLGDIETLLQAV